MYLKQYLTPADEPREVPHPPAHTQPGKITSLIIAELSCLSPLMVNCRGIVWSLMTQHQWGDILCCGAEDHYDHGGALYLHRYASEGLEEIWITITPKLSLVSTAFSSHWGAAPQL